MCSAQFRRLRRLALFVTNPLVVPDFVEGENKDHDAMFAKFKDNYQPPRTWREGDGEANLIENAHVHPSLRYFAPCVAAAVSCDSQKLCAYVEHGFDEKAKLCCEEMLGGNRVLVSKDESKRYVDAAVAVSYTHLTLPYIKEGVEELLRDARFVWQTEPLGAETRVVSGLISDGVQFICVTMWLTIDINDVKPKVQISGIVDMRTAFLWACERVKLGVQRVPVKDWPSLREEWQSTFQGTHLDSFLGYNDDHDIVIAKISKLEANGSVQQEYAIKYCRAWSELSLAEIMADKQEHELNKPELEHAMLIAKQHIAIKKLKELDASDEIHQVTSEFRMAKKIKNEKTKSYFKRFRFAKHTSLVDANKLQFHTLFAIERFCGESLKTLALKMSHKQRAKLTAPFSGKLGAVLLVLHKLGYCHMDISIGNLSLIHI